MDVLSAGFVEVSHQLNLSTWLTKYDKTPYGMFAAKIFRKMDVDRASLFIYSIFMMADEIGIPKNIEEALNYYLDVLFAVMPTSEVEAIKDVIENQLLTEVVESLPKSIFQKLTKLYS